MQGMNWFEMLVLGFLLRGGWVGFDAALGAVEKVIAHVRGSKTSTP